MSSPHAAACAALLIQSGDATTPDEIETRLKTSAIQVTRGGLSFPRIDCSPDAVVCGDGVVEDPEQCDDGNDIDTDACTNECKDAVCGDGIVRDGVEECDDGNIFDNDGCTNECKNAVCGDGIVQFFVEACDDGNTVDGDGCDSTCQNEGFLAILFGIAAGAGATAGAIALGYLIIGLSTDLIYWISK